MSLPEDEAPDAGTEPGPRCCGGGGCGPGRGIDRRQFLGGLAAGAVGLVVLPDGAAASPERRLTPEELAAWKKALFEPGEPLVYGAACHPQAAMPLGGVGCGNVYLDAGGHLRDWLIFNNLEPLQL